MLVYTYMITLRLFAQVKLQINGGADKRSLQLTSTLIPKLVMYLNVNFRSDEAPRSIGVHDIRNCQLVSALIELL